MLHEGSILPQTLQPDVPTFIDGFAPQNFDKRFEGAVPADQVIARSLNVPSVHMLRDYGVEKFHHLLPTDGYDYPGPTTGSLRVEPDYRRLGGEPVGYDGHVREHGAYVEQLLPLPRTTQRYAPTDIRPLTYRPTEVAPSSERTAHGVLSAAPAVVHLQGDAGGSAS